MTAEPVVTEKECKKGHMQHMNRPGGGSGGVYGIGLFGAWAYYIGRATSTRERVIGFFKAFAWPAFLVYDLLVFLNKKQ